MIKKFLIRLGQFVLFTILLYILFIILSGEFLNAIPGKNLYYKNSDGKLGWRLRELSKLDSELDILFLGSSRAYRHYDPRNFSANGITSFVLGSSAQTFNETEFLVEKYTQNIQPGLVVIDICPEMFRNEHLEPQLDIISHFDFKSNFMSLFDWDLRVESINTIIFSFYSNYILNRTYFEEDYNNVNYVHGGYLEKKKIEFSKNLNFLSSVEVNESQIKSLRKIITNLEKRNIRIIFVQSPMQNGLRYQNYDQFNEVINSLDQKFFDYRSSSMFQDTIHFYDINHLNQNGVNLFNKLLLDSLRIDVENIRNEVNLKNH